MDPFGKYLTTGEGIRLGPGSSRQLCERVTADGFYETPRVEMVPGEGLVEFHLRLTGILELRMPGCPDLVTVTGPQSLVMYQPAGVHVLERVLPKRRDTCVSLYCRPEFLADLARRNGVAHWSLLKQLSEHPPGSVWHRQAVLSPALLYIGKSLLESPHKKAIRLLHAEAKALELLCEVLALAQEEGSTHAVVSENEIRQLDVARRMLAENLSASASRSARSPTWSAIGTRPASSALSASSSAFCRAKRVLTCTRRAETPRLWAPCGSANDSRPSGEFPARILVR